MPKPFPAEFRDDVIRVALGREPGVIEQIATDFGAYVMTLQKWLRRVDTDDGTKPGQSRVEGAGNCSLPGTHGHDPAAL